MLVKRMCYGCKKFFIATRKDKKYCSRACYQKMQRRRKKIEHEKLLRDYEKLKEDYKELCEEYETLLKIIAENGNENKY
jgi:hypothetical protein